MKYLLLIIIAITSFSCSKSDTQVEDNTKKVKVELTYLTGTHNTTGTYSINGVNGGFSNEYQEHTVKKDLKIGDEIKATLSRTSTSGTGKFGILLMVNNKLVKSAESESSLKLEINYKITEEDTKQ